MKQWGMAITGKSRRGSEGTILQQDFLPHTKLFWVELCSSQYQVSAQPPETWNDWVSEKRAGRKLSNRREEIDVDDFTDCSFHLLLLKLSNI
jgi:hypothetical protein